MKTLFSFAILCLSLSAFGQKPLLIHDLVNFSLDSMFIPAHDSTLQRDELPHFKPASLAFAPLDTALPSSNLINGSVFTFKERVAPVFDLTEYPIGTSVKIFLWHNDTLIHNCSGSMVSRSHVLTAAHCISEIPSQELFADSILIKPAYDNGSIAQGFDSIWVSKAYHYRDWDINGEDIALLELTQPLGNQTGYIGVGFESVDSLLAEGLYYKFPYPHTSILPIDSNSYNGDTLYYQYGQVNHFLGKFVGILNGFAMPGESGSSLIRVQDTSSFVSYGTLTWSSFVRHTRLNNRTFHAIKEVIADDLVGLEEVVLQLDGLEIFPNPATDVVTVRLAEQGTIESVELFSVTGAKVLERAKPGRDLEMDLSGLPRGMYLLRVEAAERIGVRKLILR